MIAIVFTLFTFEYVKTTLFNELATIELSFFFKSLSSKVKLWVITLICRYTTVTSDPRFTDKHLQRPRIRSQTNLVVVIHKVRVRTPRSTSVQRKENIFDIQTCHSGNIILVQLTTRYGIAFGREINFKPIRWYNVKVQVVCKKNNIIFNGRAHAMLEMKLKHSIHHGLNSDVPSPNQLKVNRGLPLAMHLFDVQTISLEDEPQSDTAQHSTPN